MNKAAEVAYQIHALENPDSENMSALMAKHGEDGFIADVLSRDKKIVTLFTDGSALIQDLSCEFHDLGIIGSETVVAILLATHPYNGIATDHTKEEHEAFTSPKH